MGGSSASSTQPPRNTGPIELRDLGPNGRPLGTVDDCYDGSRWDLHRGELVLQMSAKLEHCVVMGMLTTLFNTHARDDVKALPDVYCDLTDDKGPSLRAPDVVIVQGVQPDPNDPSGGPVRGIPLLAVEIRATQSKKQLAEKIKLYVEHEWPEIWIVHTDQDEVEVIRQGSSRRTFVQGENVPLVPEVDRYGLKSLPVAAFFNEAEMSKYTHAWVERHAEVRTRAKMLLETLLMRGLDVSAAVRVRIAKCTDVDTLARWFKLAMTAPNADAFVQGLT
jgi:Uma2 family endonuclease